MPVPPTSISAATITSQAMPIDIRMPVRIVGAAAGRITVNARLSVPTSSVRATLIHSLRTLATPKTVLSSIGQINKLRLTKMAGIEESLLVKTATGIQAAAESGLGPRGKGTGAFP